MPSAPSNGRHTYNNYYSRRNYEDRITFSCNTGYRLRGSSSRTCQASGQWSGTRPTCVSKWIVGCQCVVCNYNDYNCLFMHVSVRKPSCFSNDCKHIKVIQSCISVLQCPVVPQGISLMDIATTPELLLGVALLTPVTQGTSS